MNVWMVMMYKEFLELWRSYKWIWIPLVFVALGITQPIASYYMPEILQHTGGLPEGTVIEIPMPSPEQVLLDTMDQFSLLGLLILVLTFMSSVSGERTSGTAGMILVKPVSYASFITVKWVAATCMVIVSLTLGMFGAWYYTEQLIGSVSLKHVWMGTSLFVLWLAFVMALTVCFSAVLRSSAAVAFLTFFIAILLSLLPSVMGTWMKWSPGNLTAYAGEAIMLGKISTEAWLPVVCTISGTSIFLWMAIQNFRNKELTG